MRFRRESCRMAPSMAYAHLNTTEPARGKERRSAIAAFAKIRLQHFMLASERIAA